jgi:alpha-beta hydrolase superfamily lysophospholipase
MGNNLRLIAVIILAGVFLMFGFGCKTTNQIVFDNGMSLVDLKAEVQSLTLDLGQKPAYSPVILDYFKYYGLDYEGIDHFFGTVVSGKYKIATHVFRKNNTDKTVFLIHGFILSSFLYNYFIPRLIEEGYTAVVFDLPGHGLSDGHPAGIDDFDEYGKVIDDLLGYTRDSLPPPYAVIGHSMGGAAIIDYLHARQSVFKKHVLVAPLVRSDLYDLSKFGVTVLGWALTEVPSIVRDTSSNRQYIDFITHSDPLRPTMVPISWANALFAWNERLVAANITIDADTLLIQGDKDVVVEYGYNIEFLRKRIPGIDVRFIPGAKHDIFQETEDIRNRLFDMIISYLEGKQINEAPSSR